MKERVENTSGGVYEAFSSIAVSIKILCAFIKDICCFSLRGSYNFSPVCLEVFFLFESLVEEIGFY